MSRLVLKTFSSVLLALLLGRLHAGVIAPPPVAITFEGTSPSPPTYERMALENWLNFDADFTNKTGNSLTFEEGSATLLDGAGNVTATRAITSIHLDNSRLVDPVSGDSVPDPFRKGWVTTNMTNSTDERIEATIRDRQGKILAAGWGTRDGRERIHVARYQADGTLDTSFHGDGKLATAVPGLDHVRAEDIALTSNNRIVVAGTGRNRGESKRYMVVARYFSDGEPDRSFDGDGIKSFVLGFERSECEAVLVDSSDRIVMGGGVVGAWGHDFAVVRLNSNGTFDSSFGFAGATNVDFRDSSADKIYDLAIDRAGRIIAVGSTASAGLIKFAAARFTPDGELDTSFSKDGKSAPNFFAAPDEYATCVAVDALGGLAVGGVAITGDGLRFAVARFTPSGVLDSNFGGDGKIITPIFDTADSWAEDIIFDGARIVAAGIAQDGIRDWLTLVAYQANGSLDPSFNHIGIAAVERADTVDEGAKSIVRGRDGMFYVSGHADPLDKDGKSTGLQFAMARFHNNGELDTRFILPRDTRVMWRWPYHTFPRKASPDRFNVQLRFEELASPFYMTIRPQHHEQNHRPYIFPLRVPSYKNGEWGIGFCHGFESAHRAHWKFHDGTHRNNQRYAYDISLWVDGKALKPGVDPSLNESRYSYREPVLAAADGVVVFVRDGVDENDPPSVIPGTPGGGNMVRIDHGNGEFSMYAHMIPGSITVTLGQFVEQGQMIGRLGNSGNSGGPHLHFQLMTLWDSVENHPDGIPVYFKNVGFAREPERNHQLRCGFPPVRLTLGQPTLGEPAPIGSPDGPGAVQESEPNDSFAEAQRIQAPCIVSGVLTPGDGGEIVDGGDVIEDVYRIEIEEAGWMAFRIEPTGATQADLDVVVFDSQFMAHRPEGGVSPDSSESFSAELVPGTYYVLVSIFDGLSAARPTGYQLEIERLQPFPFGVGGLTLGGVDPETIEVDWIVAEDIEGVSFTLERRPINENRFQTVADLSETGASFADEKVSRGTDYVYRIRVENEFGDVEYTEEVILSTEARIDALTPDRGSVLGGTEVVLHGVNFTEGATVLLGGQPLSDVIWVSPNEMRGVTAAHPGATVDVEVATDFGAAVLAEGFTYTEPAAVRFRRGEVNADGISDLTDAVLIFDMLFLGQAVLECQKAADVDDDNLINITDPIVLLDYLFLGNFTPAPPVERCGVDATADGFGCENSGCGGVSRNGLDQ